MIYTICAAYDNKQTTDMKKISQKNSTTCNYYISVQNFKKRKKSNVEFLESTHVLIKEIQRKNNR